MARTKGALSKPKFIGIKLSDLNKLFLPDTIIKVDKSYSFLLDSAQIVDNVENINSAPTKSEKVKMNVIDFSK